MSGRTERYDPTDQLARCCWQIGVWTDHLGCYHDRGGAGGEWGATRRYFYTRWH